MSFLMLSRSAIHDRKIWSGFIAKPVELASPFTSVLLTPLAVVERESIAHNSLAPGDALRRAATLFADKGAMNNRTIPYSDLPDYLTPAEVQTYLSLSRTT